MLGIHGSSLVRRGCSWSARRLKSTSLLRRQLRRMQQLAAGTAMISGAVLATTPKALPEAPDDEKQQPVMPPPARTNPSSRLDIDAAASSTQYLRSLPMTALLRSYFVFLACQSSLLVGFAPVAINKLEHARHAFPFGIGELAWRAFRSVMRNSFFAQFVAGETVQDSLPLIASLQDKGCATMLNWSAEADETEPIGTDTNQTILQDGINELSNATRSLAALHPDLKVKPSMLAVKVTGLIRDVSILERASEALQSSTAAARGQSSDGAEVAPSSPNLHESDGESLYYLHQNLRSLCSLARDQGIRLVFDAEQSWYQPCLDRLVSLLAREYNAGQRLPVVYNTYQANVQCVREVLQRDIEDARSNDYPLGVKLVRGAYVDAENAHAAQTGSKSKAWSTKAETDQCYDACVRYLLQQIHSSINTLAVGPSVIFATHNIPSIQKSLKLMEDMGLCHEGSSDDKLVLEAQLDGKVMYAQLLSMAESLTDTMNGLFERKIEGSPDLRLPVNCLYVPYGSIDHVIPYLLRRAQENKSILHGSDASGKGGAAQQRRAIGREIRRRILPALFA